MFLVQHIFSHPYLAIRKNLAITKVWCSEEFLRNIFLCLGFSSLIQWHHWSLFFAKIKAFICFSVFLKVVCKWSEAIWIFVMTQFSVHLHMKALCLLVTIMPTKAILTLLPIIIVKSPACSGSQQRIMD